MLKFFPLVLALFLFFLLPGTSLAGQVTAGRLEEAAILPESDGPPVLVRAKLDTGAYTSSLHAEDIRIDGERGVVSFIYVSQEGTRLPMTCPLVKITKVKSRPSGFHTRPTVRMRIVLGSRTYLTDVNLTDRSNFRYPLLLGRKLLRKGILVDSSRTYLIPLNIEASGAGLPKAPGHGASGKDKN